MYVAAWLAVPCGHSGDVNSVTRSFAIRNLVRRALERQRDIWSARPTRVCTAAAQRARRVASLFFLLTF